MPSDSPTPLILDLDQHLHRSALLESIRLLDYLISSLPPSLTSHVSLAHQISLRLTYLALHCRTDSDIQSEIRSLHRHSLHHLARCLEFQASRDQEVRSILSN